jgi:hypothetical protein
MTIKAPEAITTPVEQTEHEIKAVDVVLVLLRSDSYSAESLEHKLAIQKHIRYIENVRARLKKQLFERMDEAGI